MRKKFLVGFDFILNKILKENGFNCWLKCLWNWFSSQKKILPGHKYWKGEFQCTNCDKRFITYIDSCPIPNELVLINLAWTGNQCLVNVEGPKKRISGKERELLSYEISAKKITNFRTDPYQNDGRLLIFELK